jgi:hypothetical protein
LWLASLDPLLKLTLGMTSVSTGDIVNYRWRILESPDNMPEDVGKIIRDVDSECSFTLSSEMGVYEVGTWKIELEVRDSADNTSSDTVIVEVVE